MSESSHNSQDHFCPEEMRAQSSQILQNVELSITPENVQNFDNEEASSIQAQFILTQSGSRIASRMGFPENSVVSMLEPPQLNSTIFGTFLTTNSTLGENAESFIRNLDELDNSESFEIQNNEESETQPTVYGF